MTRYLEIAKHTLRYESEAKLSRWLWLCYLQFIHHNPSGILGDNIVIMYSNDFHELRAKAEAYEFYFKEKSNK